MNGVGPNEIRTRARTTGYNGRFSDWSMVHTGANHHYAKPYTLGKVLRDWKTTLVCPQEAEMITALEVSSNYEASNIRHKLFSIDQYVAYQGMTVKLNNY